MDPVGESLPNSPDHSHGGSDSSVEDIWDDMWDDEDPELGALPMGEEDLAGAVDGAGVG